MPNNFHAIINQVMQYIYKLHTWIFLRLKEITAMLINMMHVECENKIKYHRWPSYKINTDYSMEKHIDGLV